MNDEPTAELTDQDWDSAWGEFDERGAEGLESIINDALADRLASARVQWEKETRERERKAWDEGHKECICHAQSFHAYKHHNPYREGDSA